MSREPRIASAALVLVGLLFGCGSRSPLELQTLHLGPGPHDGAVSMPVPPAPDDDGPDLDASVGDDTTNDAPTGAPDAPADVGDVGLTADAGPDVEAGACDPSAASWDPSSSLPGLVVWLDAAEFAPGLAVGLWPDRSGIGNDANQSVSAYQPTSVSGSIGGLPAVRFDGKQTLLSIPDAPTLQWGTGDYGVFVVARFSTSLGNTNQMLFEKTTVASPYAGAQLFVNSDRPSVRPRVTSQVNGYLYATSTRDNLEDVPHLFAGRRTGLTVEVRVDGVSEGTTVTPPVDISDPGQPVMIGQNGYNHTAGFQAVQGDIAEIIAVEGSISDSDLRDLECHLLVKYGLSP